MKVEKSEVLKLKLKGDDINHFKSAIEKLAAEQKKVGFKHVLLSDDETKTIENIKEKL